MAGYIFDATKGETPGSLAQKRAIAKAMLQGQRAPQNVGEGISALGDGIVAAVLNSRADGAEREGLASASDAFAPIIGALTGATEKFPPAPAAPGSDVSPAMGPRASTMDPLSTEAATGVIPGNDLKSGILQTAEALGVDPVDLATAISYETGGTFDPTKRGPTTQWGQHRGLIQFGEPQAKQYGVDWKNPMGSQLGPDGAVAKYLRDTGVKPGMGLLDIYSAINAGGVGRYNRTDENNGGAPGTVRDKVEKQMSGHRAKALALMGSKSAPPAAQALEALAQPQPVQVAGLDPAIGVAQAGAEQGLPPDHPGLQALAAMKAQEQGGGQMQPPPMQPMPTPPGDMMVPGQPAAATTPAGMRVMGQMLDKRPMGGEQQIAQLLAGGAPQGAPPVAPPQPMQADPGLPEMAGRGGPAAPRQSGPSIEQLLAAASNPFLPEGQKAIVAAMLEQQLKQRDPAYGLDLEKRRLELEAMRNPKPEQTAEQQNLAWRAKEAGLQPGTPEYSNFMATGGRNDGTNITVNTGEGDKFFENLDKKNAETFSALSDEGVRGRSKLAQIDRLEGLLTNAPQGGIAMLKQAAGEYGINTEGLSDLQAAQALINELVPQQRQPCSGPMSDADLALFKQSLPRLINQPGGNKTILDTMRGITQYQIRMGEIADAVADREMTPKEGRQAIRSLDNPLANFGKAKPAEATPGGAPAGVDPELWNLMSPEDRALWQN